jgi:sRNA-binding protein
MSENNKNIVKKPKKPIVKVKESEFLADFKKSAAVFFPVFRNAVIPPLKVGVNKEIKSILREKGVPISSDKLNKFLFLITSTLEYKKQIAETDSRFDLDGNPAGLITESDKKDARESIQYYYYLIKEAKEKTKKKNSPKAPKAPKVTSNKGVKYGR